MVETIHWHTLHPRYLGPESRILDLGANYGHFARKITARFGAKCVAVEPSPAPFAAIPAANGITKLQLAVSDRSGTMPFHVADDSVASSLLRKVASHRDTIEVKVCSFEDLLKTLDWPSLDLLKCDIEGAEIAMLAAASDEVLSRIGQMTVEFHDFCGITPPADIHRTIERLHRLGFQSVRMSRIGHQDTWLINQRLLGISNAEVTFIRHVERNWKGLNRVIARKKAAFTGRPNPAEA